MNIGIDFDDVIVDFTKALMDFYHKNYGKKVEVKDIIKWDWGLYWGIPREEAIKRVDEFHNSHDVRNLLPLHDALKSISKLMEDNNLLIITGRPLRFNKRVKEWLSYHLKKKIDVVHAGEYHKGQAATKAELCLEEKIGLFIEDSGETALDCAKKGIRVILFDKPWNKDFSHKNIIRVKDWNEAIKKIKVFKG